MDARERFTDVLEALQSLVTNRQNQLWSALPGIVEAYNSSNMTVSVQPAVRAVIQQQDGTFVNKNLPLLVDVPLVYMGGGSYILTFPIAAGDECLVIFADRSIDNWWQSGGVQNQSSARSHSLSDGFAIVGPRSLARTVANISASTMQLRTLDGSSFFEVDAGANKARVVAPHVTVSSPDAVIDGNLSVSGTLTVIGTTNIQGVDFLTHKHTGVTVGPGKTGGVTT